MAIQFIQQPGSISFAGDPVIAKVKTTLTGKTFLRVKMTCDVKVLRTGEEFSYSENYSYETGSNGIAVFNVSSTLSTALNQYIVQEVEGEKVSQTIYMAKYKLTFKELYLDGMVEMEGDERISEEYKAIPGSLTEYERLTASTADTAAILGEGRILSRKPDGEMLPQGIALYLPAVYTKLDTINYSISQCGQTEHYLAITGGALVAKSIKVLTASLVLGEVWVNIGTETGKKKYVVEPTSEMRHFLFLNGFGLIESVTAVTREALSYDIQSEVYAVSQEIKFRTNTRVVSYATPPSASFAMSSGFVSREWAEWWVNEFVVTRRAWMWQEGQWLPVAIVPEDTNKLYDRSKPGMLAVNFTVRYSFTGGTYNSFVQGR